MVHQEGINHGGLIDDDHICLKRVVLVLLETTLVGRVFKETMNGLCPQPVASFILLAALPVGAARRTLSFNC